MFRRNVMNQIKFKLQAKVMALISFIGSIF